MISENNKTAGGIHIRSSTDFFAFQIIKQAFNLPVLLSTRQC
jgi:hypothetical protein